MIHMCETIAKHPTLKQARFVVGCFFPWVKQFKLPLFLFSQVHDNGVFLQLLKKFPANITTASLRILDHFSSSSGVSSDTLLAFGQFLISRPDLSFEDVEIIVSVPFFSFFRVMLTNSNHFCFIVCFALMLDSQVICQRVLCSLCR